jgi:hypothetical protein
MGDAWGGYKNGQIPSTAMIKVQGKFFEPHVAARMIAVLAECKKHGIDLKINEGYRPLGKPLDAKVTDVKKTSTGGYTQYFVWGVYQRGGAIAAKPGNSIHGWGKAADIQPGRENSLLVSILKAHGFTFTIPSESWHVAG